MSQGFSFVTENCGQLQLLELFQKAVIWKLGKKSAWYISQVSLLKILRLPIFMQTNFLLLITIDNKGSNLMLTQEQNCSGRNNEMFNLPNRRTEKASGVIVFNTCRIISHVAKYVGLTSDQNLTSRLINLMWKFNARISETNVSASQILLIALRVEISGHYFHTDDRVTKSPWSICCELSTTTTTFYVTAILNSICYVRTCGCVLRLKLTQRLAQQKRFKVFNTVINYSIVKFLSKISLENFWSDIILLFFKRTPVIIFGRFHSQLKLNLNVKEWK